MSVCHSRSALRWAMTALVAVAALVAFPVFAQSTQCDSGQICVVTIDGTQYTVIGPCDLSTIGTLGGGCLIISSGPVSPDPIVIYGPGPSFLLQNYDAQTKILEFEKDAESHIAALRGISNDNYNVYWSRGAVRAYMYLHLLSLANDSATSALSPDDQSAVDYYTHAVNAERMTIANGALALYNNWNNYPCGFHVPIGDPNAYLARPDVAGSLSAPCNIPPNSPACALGACIPAPPSASEFTAWAEGVVRQAETNQWGATSFTKLPYTNPSSTLTLAQARTAAAFEHDAAYGGVAAGIAFLTAQHAAIANVEPAEQSEVESDLQEQWLEGLQDFAGEHFRETVQNVLAEVFGSLMESGGGEATLAETFIDEGGLALALEEDAVGLIAESWDTLIGPAIGALAVIAFEVWNQVINANVPIDLQAAVVDANANYSLFHYAADSNGRQLILDALVTSTMPDWLAGRINDLTYGAAPTPGPAVASDPNFLQYGTQTPSIKTTDWNGNWNTTSVANGWFVQFGDTGAGPSRLRYTPYLAYTTPPGEITVTGGETTVTPLVVEKWRAWLNGNDFLAVRAAMVAGTGLITEVENACPSTWYASNNHNIGYVCVEVFETATFTINAGDMIEIAGQARKVSGNPINQGGILYVQTTEAFDPNATPPGLSSSNEVDVLVTPDGNCMTSSVLGARASGPDCISGPSISTAQGVITITAPAPIITFDIQDRSPFFSINNSPPFMYGYGSFPLVTQPQCSGTPPICFGPGSPFTTNSPGAVTFSLGAGSTGCTVTSDGIVTITAATAPSSSCVISAVQAAAGGITASKPISASFQIAQRPLQITANNASKIYGTVSGGGDTEFSTGPNVLFLGGLVGGESVVSVNLVSDGDDQSAGVSGSPYAIVPSAPVAGPNTNLSNYAITYVNGSLTVSPAPLTVTASNFTRTYFSPNPELTGTISGAVIGDQFSQSFVTTAAVDSNVGEYPIVPTVTAIDDTDAMNYAVTTVNGTLTVTGAPLTLTAASAHRVYGTANPTFAGTITGAVNGDDFQEDFNTDATLDSDGGTYAIVPSATPNPHLANYAQVVDNGTLTVEPAASGLTMINSVTTERISGKASVTLTATVTSSTIGVPTGTVTFTCISKDVDGNNPFTVVLGSAVIDTHGVATLTTTLPAGQDYVTANYVASTNFMASTSRPSQRIIVSGIHDQIFRNGFENVR